MSLVYNPFTREKVKFVGQWCYELTEGAEEASLDVGNDVGSTGVAKVAVSLVTGAVAGAAGEAEVPLASNCHEGRVEEFGCPFLIHDGRVRREPVAEDAVEAGAAARESAGAGAALATADGVGSVGCSGKMVDEEVETGVEGAAPLPERRPVLRSETKLLIAFFKATNSFLISSTTSVCNAEAFTVRLKWPTLGKRWRTVDTSFLSSLSFCSSCVWRSSSRR